MSNEIKSENNTDPWDSYIPPLNKFVTTYTEDQFNVESMNHLENVPETGGASGEANP